MEAITQQYNDLEQAIDEVRALLERWLEDHAAPSTDGAFDTTPNAQALRYAQLVLHEWLANLMQHADFQDRVPCIHVHIRADYRHIHCKVLDNSQGFDLDQHLRVQRDSSVTLPERGMGLRIISACTDAFSYRPTDDGQHHFEFSIPADHDPWLNMLF